jgi:hypothetical protein
MEKFSLKKLKEVEGKEQYPVKVPNRSTALDNLDTEVNNNNNNSVWESTKGNIKVSAKDNLGYCELKNY